MVAITAKAAMPDEAMLQTFSVNILDKPEVFLTKGDEYAEQAKAMTKHLYDLGKASETEDMKGQCSMLEELFIDGFDNEQIWEEIQMQNAPFLTYLKSQLAALKAGKTSAEKEKEEEADEGTDGEHEEMEVDEDKDGMMDSDMEHDSDMLDSAAGDEEEDAEELDDEEEVAKDDDDEQDQEEEEEEEESEEEDLDDLDLPATKKAKTSEVDDDFFKLEEFNALTEKQEQDELEGRESENDDEIDYFADPDEIESGDDFGEDDEDDENLVDAHDVKYNDFFAPVKTSRSKAKSASKKPKTRDTDGKEDEDDFGFSDEEENDTEQKEDEEEEDVKVNALGDRISDLFSKDAGDDDEDESKLSKFERMQRKMQAQIEQLEQENVAPKEWTVKGETSAADRPVNSLLEEDLEFETVAKPVPVITAETTKTLEDIIKDRILNNNFDDVVRKQPPNPKAFNPSSRVEISDEKSKKSLAELYEDEYTRQTNTGAGPVLTEKEAALEKQHEEITEAWKELCSKLDALSNWHYTPKPVKAELTVVTNAAAISMEEAIPVGVADAALLAPEEIYSAGKAPIKGDSEMDQTDRKRKRAQAKRAKKAEIKEKAKQAAERQKEREERDRRLGRQPGDKGNSKTVVRDKLEAMEKLSGQKNISFIDRDGNKRSSIKQGSQVDTSKSAKLKL
ncbi:u3 small nucleolar ribonucleoprotein MPP10 [Actinomortierella wolfii]|nr:u3 small nucleolar ribonucleoprotein MPP10 [Actinomortierella wolfii]